jgi:hypothetical protein
MTISKLGNATSQDAPHARNQLDRKLASMAVPTPVATAETRPDIKAESNNGITNPAYRAGSLRNCKPLKLAAIGNSLISRLDQGDPHFRFIRRKGRPDVEHTGDSLQSTVEAWVISQVTDGDLIGAHALIEIRAACVSDQCPHDGAPSAQFGYDHTSKLSCSSHDEDDRVLRHAWLRWLSQAIRVDFRALTNNHRAA